MRRVADGHIPHVVGPCVGAGWDGLPPATRRGGLRIPAQGVGHRAALGLARARKLLRLAVVGKRLRLGRRRDDRRLHSGELDLPVRERLPYVAHVDGLLALVALDVRPAGAGDGVLDAYVPVEGTAGARGDEGDDTVPYVHTLGTGINAKALFARGAGHDLATGDGEAGDSARYCGDAPVLARGENLAVGDGDAPAGIDAIVPAGGDHSGVAADRHRGARLDARSVRHIAGAGLHNGTAADRHAAPVFGAVGRNTVLLAACGNGAAVDCHFAGATAPASDCDARVQRVGGVQAAIALDGQVPSKDRDAVPTAILITRLFDLVSTLKLNRQVLLGENRGAFRFPTLVPVGVAVAVQRQRTGLNVETRLIAAVDVARVGARHLRAAYPNGVLYGIRLEGKVAVCISHRTFNNLISSSAEREGVTRWNPCITHLNNFIRNYSVYTFAIRASDVVSDGHVRARRVDDPVHCQPTEDQGPVARQRHRARAWQ